jgi:hypothetical protein
MKTPPYDVNTGRVIATPRLSFELPQSSRRTSAARSKTQPAYRRNRRTVNRAAQHEHRSAALDPSTNSTRLLVWLTFAAAGLCIAAGITMLASPGEVAPPTWSASIPGSLKLDGKPVVDTELLDGGLAKIVISDEDDQQAYTVRVDDPASVRTFWRGSDLVVDTAEQVWRIDTRHELLLRAQPQYAWPTE